VLPGCLRQCSLPLTPTGTPLCVPGCGISYASNRTRKHAPPATLARLCRDRMLLSKHRRLPGDWPAVSDRMLLDTAGPSHQRVNSLQQDCSGRVLFSFLSLPELFNAKGLCVCVVLLCCSAGGVREAAGGGAGGEGLVLATLGFDRDVTHRGQDRGRHHPRGTRSTGQAWRGSRAPSPSLDPDVSLQVAWNFSRTMGECPLRLPSLGPCASGRPLGRVKTVLLYCRGSAYDVCSVVAFPMP